MVELPQIVRGIGSALNEFICFGGGDWKVEIKKGERVTHYCGSLSAGFAALVITILNKWPTQPRVTTS